MAKDKDKSLNPVAAHHKSEKRAAVKKNKAAVSQAREDRLSKRNPARIEKQIAELRALEASGQPLRPKDKDTLRLLERDLNAIRRARERAGGAADNAEGDVRAQQRERREGHTRRARDNDDDDEGEQTDPEVRAIPMPRDTPPPVPRTRPGPNKAAGLFAGKENDGAPRPVAQVTYSSKPILKDLRGEATRAKFAPGQVRRNIERVRGKGGVLLEEEELERLERGGYGVAALGAAGAGRGEGMAVAESAAAAAAGPGRVGVEDVEDEDL